MALVTLAVPFVRAQKKELTQLIPPPGVAGAPKIYSYKVLKSFTHDEGACYAPQALRQATLLVHWGRTHRRPNGSSEYHLWRVKPWGQRMYGWERCYDPCKDLVTSPHLAPPRPTSPNLARPRTTSRDLARPRAISPTLVRSHRPRSAQVLPP